MQQSQASDRSVEDADPLCVDAATAAGLLAGAPWRRFAVMGDSFAAGVGDPSEGYETLSWPERVSRALGADAPLAYLNTGVVGVQSGAVVDDQLAAVLEFAPDLVVVTAGGNDLWVDTPDYAATERNLDTLYTAVRDQGATVVAFTVADVFDALPALAMFRDRMAELNARIRTVAERHDAVLVEMWEHPVRHRPGVMSADGVHFSVEGQAALATEIVKALSTRIRSGGGRS